jgi:hypothetical protein
VEAGWADERDTCATVLLTGDERNMVACFGGCNSVARRQLDAADARERQWRLGAGKLRRSAVAGVGFDGDMRPSRWSLLRPDNSSSCSIRAALSA